MAAQPCPCPPRAPLLSCLFPSPYPQAPLCLRGLRCPLAIFQGIQTLLSVLFRDPSGVLWAPCWSLASVPYWGMTIGSLLLARARQ